MRVSVLLIALLVVLALAFVATSTEGVSIRSRANRQQQPKETKSTPAQSRPQPTKPTPDANAARIKALEAQVAKNTAHVTRYNVRNGMTDPNAPKATRGRFTKKDTKQTLAVPLPASPVTPPPAPVSVPVTPAPTPAPVAPVTPPPANLGPKNYGAICSMNGWDKSCTGGLTCEYDLGSYNTYCADHILRPYAGCDTRQQRCPQGYTCITKGGVADGHCTPKA